MNSNLEESVMKRVSMKRDSILSSVIVLLIGSCPDDRQAYARKGETHV